MPAFRTTRRSIMAVGGAALARATLGPAGMAHRASARATSPTLTGQVIRPGDPEYDGARLAYNSRFSRYPAAIVRCGNTADVQNAVRWARENDVPLRARSGGHSYEGFSVVDDGLVIDVSPLNRISVDPARGEAVVGAGVRLHELYQTLWEHGVTVPAGSCPSVGIAGLALGGGIGLLARQFGLTCDNLVAAKVVDANGDVLHARSTEHPDLYWALRGGGGGNFGVVTAFTFRLHPIGNVAICSLEWSQDAMAEVIDAWQDWAPAAGERLTAVLTAQAAANVNLIGVFDGPETELNAELAPLLAATPALTSSVHTTPFIDFIVPPGTPPSQTAFKNTSSLAYAPIDATGIATFVEQMSQAMPPGANLVQFFPFGGAIETIDPSATAFVHRRARFDLQYQAYWWDAAYEADHVNWVRGIRESMLPYMNGAYVNYIDADIANFGAEYYGTNLPRLKQVKATYDPDDVFNGPQSIPV